MTETAIRALLADLSEQDLADAREFISNELRLYARQRAAVTGVPADPQHAPGVAGQCKEDGCENAAVYCEKCFDEELDSAFDDAMDEARFRVSARRRR